MMPRDRVQKAIENRTIEIAPLAYMRGRTLSDAFVILDEAQNATGMQMKMFLTRLGVNSRAVITGTRRRSTSPTGRIPDCSKSSGSCPGSKGSGSATWGKGTSCATVWCATSSGRTPRTHKADMRLPTKEQLRYHGSRWAWVVGLATLTYVVFPSSATNVELLVVGTPAEHDVIAPFTFPVNKSDQERVREAEELASSVKPIYQYRSGPSTARKSPCTPFSRASKPRRTRAEERRRSCRW